MSFYNLVFLQNTTTSTLGYTTKKVLLTQLQILFNDSSVASDSYYRLNLTTYYYWTMDITLPSDSYYRLVVRIKRNSTISIVYF